MDSTVILIVLVGGGIGSWSGMVDGFWGNYIKVEDKKVLVGVGGCLVRFLGR